MAQTDRKVGWYVDVPAALMAEFKRQYPGRGAMTKLTIAAIQRALKVRPTIEPTAQGKDQGETGQLRSFDVPDMPSEVRAEDDRGLDIEET